MVHLSTVGKVAEYFIISELLANDFSVYLPVNDIEGVDLIIRSPEGAYIDVQVKSKKMRKDSDKIRFSNFFCRENYLIILYDDEVEGAKNDYFIFPSKFVEQRLHRDQNGNMTLSVYDAVEAFEKYRNEKGIAFLKKALHNERNHVPARTWQTDAIPT